jgi:NAD(P)-binding Rossmann-like domain
VVTTATETDYLVIGAGAMGMAFVDTLMSETDATVVLVDRYHRPGGHWTTAYPFVRLHQSSMAYGVNSRALGSDTIDRTGWNAGLYELATDGELCAYYDAVMQQQLLPTGRVSYFPMCEYQGERRFRSFSGDDHVVNVRRRVVDATYMNVVVSSMRPPPYEVAAGVQCVAPNALPTDRKRHDRYTIVGAGKTAMDTCLWLLWHGIEPAALTWIRPREAWLHDRANTQTGPEFRDRVRAGARVQNEAINEATSIEDLFERLAAGGRLLRISDDVRPTMYRCATVSLAELEQLRGIKDVVRLGRVRRIERDRIILADGSVPTHAGTLHIDCSADGAEQRPAVPVFDGARMTLQSVTRCQQVFSSAFIAHVEAAYSDDALKNELCAPVPHPDSDADWLRTTMATNRNYQRWSEDAELQAWLDNARLNLPGYWSVRLPSDPTARAEALRQRRVRTEALNAKLQDLLRQSSLGAGF